MKILLCTTSLGYGGAETHVITLAEKLTDLGNKVTVASSGGELTKFLPPSVAHVRLPKFSRSPINLITSYLSLKKLIGKGNFDIVHSHARLPALLCHRIAKGCGAVHIVTAHALFKMTPPLRRLSNWGDATIAVSEDIKELVSTSCRLCPDKIRVIPNGIDTDRFSPVGKTQENTQNILFVSRLDSDCSLAARLLCKIAGRLRREFSEIKITIVGGGDDLEAISALADGMNTALGEKVINILGQRGDIEKIIPTADIFVGVSRAALEAAACGIPVILAGNEGYGGILFENNEKNENLSNFCCRGNPLPTADDLFEDLSTLLSAPPDYLRRLGEKGRRYVLNFNSINHTTKETEKLYRETIRSQKVGNSKCRVTICGYYGFENSGDDAILESLIKILKSADPPPHITALTARPKISSRRFGVKCVNRLNPVSLLAALISSRYLIFGGGTLLQNSTSPASLKYYLTVGRLADLCGCRIIIASSGIGPIYGRRAAKKTAGLLGRALHIGLREESALDTLISLGANPRSASIFADFALLNGNSTVSRVDFLLSRALFPLFSDQNATPKPNTDKFFVISIREEKTKRRRGKFPRTCSDDKISRLAASLDDISGATKATPIIMILSPEDEKISLQLKKKMTVSAAIIKNPTPSEAMEILARASLAIGMRLHLLIYALSSGTPAIGLVGDPKITAQLNYFRQPPPFPSNLPSPAKLTERAISMLNSAPALRPIIAARAAELRSLAREEGEIIKRMVEK